MNQCRGIILEVFYPSYLDDFDYRNVNKIGFKVELETGEVISLVKDKEDKYNDLYKGDDVFVSVFKVKYSRGEYLSKLKDYIDINYGNLDDDLKMEMKQEMALFNTLTYYDIGV